MANKAFQKIYTKLEAITKATVALKASGVSNDELALVDGRLAQVVKTKGDLVTLQVFSGTEGIPTDAEVVFLGGAPTLNVSDDLAGRFFNAYGEPIDGGPAVEERQLRSVVLQLTLTRESSHHRSSRQVSQVSTSTTPSCQDRRFRSSLTLTSHIIM
jgi:vacuolar-type H+-ATPase subunit B/Vma2